MLLSFKLYSSRIHSWKIKFQNILSLWFIKEILFLNKLALPNTLAYILSNLNKFVCLVFAGHISSDNTFFDASSIALSFTNVTGGAISIGLSSALATLCSQAYGAKQYRQSGLYYQKAIFIHALACFPLAALWLNLETILLLMHQNPDVAKVAGQFLTYFSFCLPAIQLSYITLKLFQSHNLILPQVIITSVGVLMNGIGQYVFVIYLKLGIPGCAVAFTASEYFMAIGCILYIRLSHLYQQTWGQWRVDALYDWYQYFKYGIPGMLMLCFEWWSFEFGYFAVGAIAPYPKIELGIYSVLMNFSGLVYSIPLGYMIATTVRVGNLLGHNEPDRARWTSYLCLGTILCAGFIQFIVMFFSRHWLSLLYTSDRCILAGSKWPIIIVSTFQIIDDYQSVAGGVITGCGRQRLGAIINIVTYGLVSLPFAIAFAFILKWYTSGFWLGLGIGVFTQAFGYTLVMLCVNWRKAADLAMKNAGVSLDHELNDKEEKSPECHINYEANTVDTLDEKIVCGSDDNESEETIINNIKPNISNDSSIEENFSQESEIENTNLLLELQSKTQPENKVSHNTSKFEFVFMIASRTLTLIMCLLFLMLGIIVRNYDFSISFQQFTNSTNSSSCPYN